MSHAHPTASSSRNQSSNFQLIINNALDAYKKRTKNDLLAHPLVTELQSCNSPSTILAVLQRQLQGLDQTRRSDERWSRWLDPIVNVLYTLSGTLGEGVGLVFSPAKVIFAGVGVLLSAAKDVRASQDTLIDVFERIEMFFRRLETYTQVPLTTDMMDMMIQIMVEVLSILGIATKEIKQGRMKKFARKLIGRTEIEDALKRLDKLTQEEARMAAAQNLKATHTVDERVKGVADAVEAIDNKVADVDDRVAGVGDQVAGVDDRVKEIAGDVDEMRRNQLRESTHKWLSPPDPSTNHNIACGTHHKKTATWFFQGGIYQEWKATGPLLWVHGKPGSGKSVICSTVIQDIESMCKAGNASMAYFYFDFRDANKQGLRDLVSSLLTQLSARSGPCCDILSDLYLSHDKGKSQPSDSSLAECLKRLVSVPNQPPIYLIIDALDESSNTSGISSPREMVLQLLKELVDLSLPNLHICVTSRPEFDIRNLLEPLASRRVSLHDQSGQKQDIEDYVRSVVYSDSQQIMKRWRIEDKELVIKTLSERADGMFRWVFCQLETLRHCLPPSVRPTLDELPESLDETYERVLKEIKKPHRDHARRLLQCLVAAIRPLRVEELAEVLAVDFDDAEGIPQLNPNWRWEDEEQALLTSCSSLIVIIETEDSRVVQFSHFSVKEFLTSTRLASSIKELSHYHINLEPAHTILAQACMGILLQADDGAEDNGIGKSSSLAGYAAEHWVTHAQFERVSSFLRKAMENLFDLDKPFFTAWLKIYDVDIIPDPESSSLFCFTGVWPTRGSATPLYYAALCGFRDLVEHLAVKHLQHVNTRGGWYLTPLAAALAGRHFQTVKILHHNGAHLDVRSENGEPLLHSAAWYGDVEMVEVLLGYKVDVNALREDEFTSLHVAAMGGARVPRIQDVVQSSPDVVRILLEHGADVSSRTGRGLTPLHVAAQYGSVELVRILLEHGADVSTRTDRGLTPLHVAAQYGSVEFVRLLLEHGSDPNARSNDSSIPLHLVGEDGSAGFWSSGGSYEVIRVLLERGANVAAKDDEGRTPLYRAAGNWRVEPVRMLLENSADLNVPTNNNSTPLHAAAANNSEVLGVLLERGANIGAKDDEGRTPLHRAAQDGLVELVRLLLENDADISARTYNNSTPLHAAAANAMNGSEVLRVLLERGANIGAKDDEGRTPLHRAAQDGSVELVRLLLEHGADPNARSNDSSIPLHLVVDNGSEAFRSPGESYEVVRILLERGANVAAKDDEGRTPLYRAAGHRRVEPVRMLLEHGADLNARTNNDSSPLHVAVANNMYEVVRVLLERGANVGAKDDEGRTPLHRVAQNGSVEIIRLLLKHGADPNARGNDNSIPLHLVGRYGSWDFWISGGSCEVVRVLLERGANVAAKDDEGRTPLCRAAGNWSVEPVRMLLERGADLNARTNNNSTPLHAAGANEMDGSEVLRVLLERGVNICAKDDKNRTPLHEAAKNWNVKLARKLLERGANVNAEDDEGRTPLHEAAKSGGYVVARMLLKRGADVGAKNYEGRTPFQLALANGHKANVKLLSEYGAKGALHVNPTSTSSLCLPW